MKTPLLALALLLAGCQSRGRTVVRVSIPDLDGVETPVPGLSVTFLPYDRDSILASLEAKASPRPHTKELDSLYQGFREPFQAFLRIVAKTDRLRHERDSLTSKVGPGQTSARLGLVNDSLAQLTPLESAARNRLDRARSSLGPAIDTLRAAVRQWSDTTYAGYRDLVRSMGERVFANPVSDTTDALGWASIQLTDGPWWATTVNIDPTDPHREWYWNVRIVGDTMWLNPKTGRNRPRY